MANLIDEFVGFTQKLNQKGVDYAVCGGWAIAEEHEYDVEGLPLHFADGAIEIRRISKIDKATKKLFTLDFLLVTKALEEVWEKRELIAWEDGETWVVSRQGLITMKSISGREQDLLDIKKLSEVEDES